MDNVIEGGKYRDVDVKIIDAKHSSPYPILQKLINAIKLRKQ